MKVQLQPRLMQKQCSLFRYSISTRHASKIFKDRPTKPVDTALWWVEYVLRNEDTSHLKSHNSKKSWYEKRMLDIWGFMALVLIFGSFAILLIMKSLMNFIINNIFFPTKAALKMKKID
jgi:ribosomal protein L22